MKNDSGIDRLVERYWEEKNSENINDVFKLIQREYQGFVKQLLLFQLKDKDLVEDIYSDILLSIYGAIENKNYQTRGTFGNWISVIAKNKCKNHFKKLKYSKEISDYNLSERGVRTSLKNIVLRKIRNLKDLDDQKKEVLLDRGNNKSYEEIALKTGVSIGTVKSRLCRARRSPEVQELRKFLKRELAYY